MTMNLIEEQSNKETTSHQSSETLLFIPGIWVNRKYHWLQNCTEKVIYEEELTLNVKHDQVHSKIRVAHIFVSNHSNHIKSVKVLGMHHFANVGKDHLTFVSPMEHRIFHHSNKQVYLVSGHFQESELKECTTTPLWNTYTDQIWNSLQTGTLKYQPMAKGPAASIFSIKIDLQPHETTRLNTWTIRGSQKNELIGMEEALLKKLGNK